MTTLWQDLALATRLLLRSPAFLAAAAGTLALGVALVTVMFSAVDQVLLRPLPFAEPGRLVAVRQVERWAKQWEANRTAPPRTR